jgi:nicotinamidase-related amidase
MDKDSPVFEKKQFSMVIPEVKAFLEGKNATSQKMDTVVLFGIETHVCIQQTALDLIKDNYKVVLPVDGVSSQRPGDREVALALLRSAGATLTTTESLLYSLIGTADHPSFKDLAKLVQAHNAKKATNLATLR